MAYQNGPKKFQQHLAAKKASTTLAERVDAQIAAITAPPARNTTRTEPPPSPKRQRHMVKVHLFSLKCQAKQLVRSIQNAEDMISNLSGDQE